MSVLQEVRLIRHPLVGSRRWAAIKDSESQSFNHGVFKKKRSFQKALDISPNDERTFSPTEHWAWFITLAAVLSDAQPNPLTKMYPFLILKGIQEIVGTKS